jgi:hypothetical protein
MFNKNVFTQKDPIADIIKGINEADYKAKMEELKGNQHKIDKNKNNKVDADDFKILRGEKKAMKEEEEVDESNNPFDVKNYKSQLKTKPGEKAGFDSKKISTGTVYTRKPVKDEPMKKEEIDPNDTTTDTLKGREKTSNNKFLSKKVKMDVPDNVKEDVEQIDELKKSTVKSYMNKKVDRIHKDADLQYPFKPIPITKKEVEKNTKDLMRGHARLSGVKPTSEEVEDLDEANTETKQEFLARQQRLAAAHSETQKDPKRLARLMKIPGYADAMKLAQKTTQKEEVVVEGSGPKEKQKTPYRDINSPEYRAAAEKQKQKMKDAAAAEPGKKMLSKMNKEEVEDLDERTLTKGETAEKERIVKSEVNGHFLPANFVDYIEVPVNNQKLTEYLENRNRPYKYI